MQLGYKYYTIRSQTPPMCGDSGGLSFHCISLRMRDSSILSWFILSNSSSFEATLKFVQQSERIMFGRPLLQIKRSKTLMKSSDF